MLSVILRIIIAIVLFAAAALKLYVVMSDVLDYREITVRGLLYCVLAGGEIVLAMWSLRPQRYQLWNVVALGTFASFAIASGVDVYNGLASCGCFGRLTADPRIVFTFDVLVVVALAVSVLVQHQRLKVRVYWIPPRAAALIGATILMISAGGAFVWEKRAIAPATSGDLPLLVGFRFNRVFSSTLPAASLETGKCIILAYRENCPACLLEVERYRRLQHELSTSGSSTKVFVLNAPIKPPTVDDAKRETLADGIIISGPTQNIPSPTAFVLDNNIITFVAVHAQ